MNKNKFRYSKTLLFVLPLLWNLGCNSLSTRNSRNLPSNEENFQKLENAINNLQDKILDTKPSPDKIDLNAIKNMIEELVQEVNTIIQSLSVKCDENSKEITNLSAKLDSNSDEIEKKIASLFTDFQNELKIEFASLLENQNETNQKIDALFGTVKDLETKFDDLVGKVVALITTVKGLDGKVDALDTKIDNIKKTLDTKLENILKEISYIKIDLSCERKNFINKDANTSALDRLNDILGQLFNPNKIKEQNKGFEIDNNGIIFNQNTWEKNGITGWVNLFKNAKEVADTALYKINQFLCFYDENGKKVDFQTLFKEKRPRYVIQEHRFRGFACIYTGPTGLKFEIKDCELKDVPKDGGQIEDAKAIKNYYK